MAKTSPLLFLAALLSIGACSCDDDPGNGDGDTGVGDTGVVGADGAPGEDAQGVDVGPRPDVPGSEICPSGSCVCSNGIDDDGDGLIDGMDPECTGPNDNDEGSFATGIPGDNRDPVWQDCFFDGNSGAGDDGCRYRTGCLTGELPPDDPDCVVTTECVEFCAPRTPNGCDCFGCCEVTLPGGEVRAIQTGADCSLDDIDECNTCVPSTMCENVCGMCELCPGRTVDDLPEECDPGMYECEDGVTCETSEMCGEGEYCSLGCCLVVLI